MERYEKQKLSAPRIEWPSQGKASGLASRRDEGSEARTAVLVVHGMGQQLTFQTLDDVVTGLRHEHKARTARNPCDPRPSVGIIHPTSEGVDRLVPRASLSLGGGKAGAGGDKADVDRDVDVDFYECYWAPLTQGAIGIRPVMGFLLSAGWNGLKNAQSGLTRMMFGREVDLEKRRKTTIWLWLALMAVGALMLINALSTLIAAAQVLGAPARDWISESLINSATWVVLGTVGWMGLSLAFMWFLRWMWCFYSALMGLIAGAGFLLYVLGAHRYSWPIPDGLAILGGGWIIGTWLALLVVSYKVRGLLVEYVGDVAIYVQPHKLGKFDQLRAAIKAEARAIADVVYGLKREDGSFQYDRVAIVGHSLGSVVAYDMLNDQLVRDIADEDPKAGQPPKQIATRTRLLLTFGSPLDKIAFLFQGQGKREATTRRQLAAARQPLILDYAHRANLKWINIHSPKDIISGSLEYFDDPEDKSNQKLRVQNIEDGECKVPLKAHVEYWDNRLVFQKLYDALVEVDPREEMASD